MNNNLKTLLALLESNEALLFHKNESKLGALLNFLFGDTTNVKLLRSFAESIEYDPDKMEVDTTHYPEFIKRLADEVEQLDKETQKAYERDDPDAVELDTLFAQKKEELEAALSELEGEEPESDLEELMHSGEHEELLRQFATIYRHWHEKIPFQGHVLTKDELLQFLRSWARDYGYRLGGFKEKTTDEQLLDAAEDAYQRIRQLRRRNIEEDKDNFSKEHIKMENFSKKRWQQLAGILQESKKDYVEVQSDLFRESGANASTDFENKIPKYAAYMKKHGWGKMPPVHGYISIIDKNDVEDYIEAEEDGYEHELGWSRPLTYDDVGKKFVSLEDGHNRAYAAREAGIPIRVKVF